MFTLPQVSPEPGIILFKEVEIPAHAASAEAVRQPVHIKLHHLPFVLELLQAKRTFVQLVRM